MKKLLMFGIALILLIGISCEKEKVELSEFVVGNWKSQEMTLGDSPLGYFVATINADNTYVLAFTLTDGSASITSPATGYSIDDANSQITITEPNFEGEEQSGDPIMIIFDVTWHPDGNTMTWTPVDVQEDGPPVLVWTKQ
jgi:hypothetical protein